MLTKNRKVISADVACVPPVICMRMHAVATHISILVNWYYHSLSAVRRWPNIKSPISMFNVTLIK